MRRVTTVLITAVALVSIAAAGLLGAGCGGSSVPSDAVATVGDVTVTKTDFQQLMTQAQTQMKAQGMTLPKEGSASYDHYASQVVNYLVEEQIVAQSAKDLGVQVTDKEVNDQVAQLEKAYGGEQKVLELLKGQGMTLDLLKRSIRSQTLSSRAAAVVTQKASVSDADIQAYWNAHKSQLSKKKKTATLAKAKATIEQTLLSAKQQEIWKAWIAERTKALGVEYAAAYDPAKLTASPSASPAG
jgi:FKBP-type peptidyl-prolyl cis-trans isomerase (trigger factor)